MKTGFMLTLLFSAVGTLCTAEPPHIGYIYPAGGQQGSSFEVEIGGQHLQGATNIFVGSPGIQVKAERYCVKYERRQLGKFYNQLKNLSAGLEDKSDKERLKMEKHIAQIKEQLALLDLPAGIDPTDRKAVYKALGNNQKDQFNPQIAERITATVTLDKNAPAGEHELRIYTAEGLSNPVYFEVGTLNEAMEKEPNDDHMGPDLQTLSLPVLINGQVTPGDMDHFRFNADKGDSIVVNVAARRIIPYLADAVPGWFQAVVALYDKNGHEVAYDDDYKFNPDPVLFFKVPESGTYTLSIRDAIYRGREDFIYRIAIGELPFITGIFPIGGQQGKNVNIALQGWNLPQSHITGKLPDAAGTTRTISVLKAGYRSNEMPFAIDMLPDVQESEPNNSIIQARPVSLPVIINGRIQESGDHDVYSFHGEKGETISIGVAARQLNAPLDSVLSLSGPGLTTPVRNDDYMRTGQAHLHLGAGLITHHADSYLLHVLPETGIYFVDIGDTQAKGGADYAYRLRIAPAQPDFSLQMDPSGVQIAPGGTAVFNVRAIRKDGFSGAISIHATHLPNGYKISHAEIAKDANTCLLTITAPAKIGAKTLSPAIFGTATINEITIKHPADPVDDQMQAFLYRHLVPAQELILTPAATPAPVALEARRPPSGVFLIPLGKETRIPLKGFVRTEKRGTTVSLENPPTGLTVLKGWMGRDKKARKENDAAAGSILIKAEAPLAPETQLTVIPVAILKNGKEESYYPGPAIKLKIVAANKAHSPK